MEVSKIDLKAHSFMQPVKVVKLPNDIKSKWDNSQALHDLLAFIAMLNNAVKDTKMTDPCHVSQATQQVLLMLEKMDKWIEDFPPINQPQRYGNKAYRDWHNKLNETKEELVRDIYPNPNPDTDAHTDKHTDTDAHTDKDADKDTYADAIKELSTYLIEGVGNATRIDYGTGHELAFTAFLCCLYKIGVMKDADCVAMVMKIFHRYIELMRKIQLTYRLEPAGSQGVWNLDDYQFIPFIYGSSQLINHKQLTPTSFLEDSVCKSMADDYIFYGCILYINQVKKGPFAEHSNQLWNISGVPTWAKVNQGLLKMYRAEVLSKFPVIQHFLFGSLLKIDPVDIK